jgi:hypothetical protein
MGIYTMTLDVPNITCKVQLGLNIDTFYLKLSKLGGLQFYFLFFVSFCYIFQMHFDYIQLELSNFKNKIWDFQKAHLSALSPKNLLKTWVMAFLNTIFC